MGSYRLGKTHHEQPFNSRPLRIPNSRKRRRTSRRRAHRNQMLSQTDNQERNLCQKPLPGETYNASSRDRSAELLERQEDSSSFRRQREIRVHCNPHAVRLVHREHNILRRRRTPIHLVHCLHRHKLPRRPQNPQHLKLNPQKTHPANRSPLHRPDRKCLSGHHQRHRPQRLLDAKSQAKQSQPLRARISASRSGLGTRQSLLHQPLDRRDPLLVQPQMHPQNTHHHQQHQISPWSLHIRRSLAIESDQQQSSRESCQHKP
jgi:hypothetical protein